jgi:hypothetical protein
MTSRARTQAFIDNERGIHLHDVERVRSGYSQVEEGLLETRSTESAHEKDIMGGVTVKLPLVASGEGKAGALYRDSLTETTSLHDHMFNFLEDRLLESGDLIDLATMYPDGTWSRDGFAERVSPTAFVRVRGPVRINDYKTMASLFAEMPRLTRALAEVVTPLNTVDSDKRKKAISAIVAEMDLPPKAWIEQLLLLLDQLFGDAVVMKCRPFDNCAFVAKVNPAWLRDDLRTLLFRFGSQPVDAWTMVGQIARVPAPKRWWMISPLTHTMTLRL